MQLSGIFGAVHRLRKASDSGPRIAWGQTAWQWKTLVERWAFLWRSVCDSWRELQNMSESEDFFESSMLCMYIISTGFHAYICTQHRIIHEMWDVPGHGNSSWLTFMGINQLHLGRPHRLRGTWIRGVLFKGGASLRGRCFFKRGRGGCFFPDFFGGRLFEERGGVLLRGGGHWSGGPLLKEEEGSFFMGEGGPSRGV